MHNQDHSNTARGSASGCVSEAELDQAFAGLVSRPLTEPAAAEVRALLARRATVPRRRSRSADATTEPAPEAAGDDQAGLGAAVGRPA